MCSVFAACFVFSVYSCFLMTYLLLVCFVRLLVKLSVICFQLFMACVFLHLSLLSVVFLSCFFLLAIF